ncbi:NACHT domain-containing protein [Streptomyces sp. NPDC101237]|uniref:NACHT domain-containing protein n=1 Tax=Streptomyces sp. NPDC101237 TaxID=3366139 RepID=UPI00382AD24D
MRSGWHTPRGRRRLALSACAVALVALTAVLRFWRHDAAAAGVLVSAIGTLVSVAALVADVLRGDADPAPASTGEQRRRAADALAEAVREQWAAEARLRRLQDPEPIEVDWALADRRLADHPQNIRRMRPAAVDRDRPAGGDGASAPLRDGGSRAQEDGVAQGHHPAAAGDTWRGPGVPAPRPSEPDGPARGFDALPAQRLVVLGGPGSGKSVLALRFVLARLSGRRAGDPVPVIFPLSGWDPRRTGLRDWLTDRLATDYPPLAAVTDNSRTLARGLLDAGLVVPVLDGFDELAVPARADAVRRINAELDADLPLLLTSRTAAWAAAVTQGDVLTAAEVVELLPLRLGTAAAHLERTSRPRRGADGTSVTVWSPVLRHLARHPRSPLAEALGTPLMVSLARTVYGDTSRDPAELLDPGRFASAEALEEHLLGAFVPAAYADAEPQEAQDAVRRLVLLARELRRRDTGRLAWWELEELLPRALRLYAPGLLSMAVLAALALPVAVTRAVRELAGTEDVLSLVATLVGQTAGFALGVARLLPRGEGGTDRRFLVHQSLTVTGVSTALWAAVAYTDDLRFGFRFGSVTDGWLPDLLGGCLFSLLFTLFFGIAGLARRPLPLGLPWTGAAERAWARVCGALLVLGGSAVAVTSVVNRSTGPWPVLVGLTATGAGTILLVSGAGRADRAAAPPRTGRIVRRFATGMVRGTAVAMLTGVTACTLAGFAAAGVTVLTSGAAPDLAGRRLDGWRYEEHGGVRTATAGKPSRGTLLIPGGGARPVAYPAGAVPPDCTIPLVRGRHCAGFRTRVTVFESRHGQVVLRLSPGARGRPEAVAYAANLRSVLPPPARAWLTEASAPVVLARLLPTFVASGVLLGVVGGCVCGVYAALSVPSDTMRTPGPRSSLRTDRTASLTRGGVVALLVALVCVPVTLVPGDRGGLAHVSTQLWLPLGTAALALSAWGRLAVARCWLALTGRLPWRLLRFLDDAHRRGVLRQSGAYYEFRHQRLQSYLAGPGDASAAPPGPRESREARARDERPR